MLELHLRRLTFAAVLVACAGSGKYTDDASVRRSALEASLASKTNGYARLRLAHYATGTDGDWDALPVWNPRTELVRASELDDGVTSSIGADARAIAIGSDLRALGEEAFSRYPVQRSPAVSVALASRAAADGYGLWTDERAGGIVRVEGGGFAYTCSTCHSRGAPGVPNAKLDVGAMLADSLFLSGDLAANVLAWGPGRLDVTTKDGTEPVRIPDLRPIRFQTHIHATASVALHDVTSLAVRIETLIITSNDMTVRPPREIALGLATYLFSLADGLPAHPDGDLPGKTTFDSRCAGCHVPPSFTGPPVPLAAIGTDPRVGLSAERGTGTYRVPSLRGVGTRGPLLHDGSASSLEMMFDPARTSAGFVSRLGAPIPGHPFGLDLDAAARADLIAYLRTL
jgi:cytochrome c5